MKAVIDTDVLLKATWYGLLYELVVTPISIPPIEVGVLGAARYVVLNRIEQADVRGCRANKKDALRAFLETVSVFEPTVDEALLAAHFESVAQQNLVNLDIGESQLCAVIVTRMLTLLLTGDKRAVAALEKLLDVEAKLLPLEGKVRCLEQLVGSAVAADFMKIRESICAEPAADKALTICLGCHSAPDAASTKQGLTSYIDSLRAVAPRMLANF